MTYVRKIYQIRLITTTFDHIESPIFKQRRDTRKAAILATQSNLTTSENNSENGKDNEKMDDTSIVKMGNNWGRFL